MLGSHFYTIKHAIFANNFDGQEDKKAISDITFDYIKASRAALIGTDDFE